MEAGIHQYLLNASNQQFSVDQIKELSTEIASFIAACNAAGLDSSQVFVKGDVAAKLNDFFTALVDFNRRLALEHKIEYVVPLEKPESSLQALAEIQSQLLFQSSAIASINAA